MTTSKPRMLVRLSVIVSILFSLTACISTTGITSRSKLLTDKQLDLVQVDTSTLTTFNWSARYDCKDLDELIHIAIKENPSLKLAEARVRQAEAAVALEGASDGPIIDGNIERTRQRLSLYGMYPASLGGAVSNLYSTGINVNYIFDIWGKTRAQIRAALNEKAALQVEAEEARRILELSITSQYFQYQALQKEVQLLEQIVKQYEVLLNDSRLQHQVGILPKNQVDQVQIELLTQKKALSGAQTQLIQTKHAIASLIGTTASHLPVLQADVLPKPQLTDLDSLTLNMMGYRVDVIAARLRVESYLHAMQAAKKQFYPSISLSAFAGFTALHFKDWFKRDAYQTFLTPAINLPIFHRGALRANLRHKTAQFDAAIEQYNQTLLFAVQDVAAKYSDLAHAEKTWHYELSVIQSARSTKTLADARYQAGILPKSIYLNSEIALFQAKRQLNMAQHQRLQKELMMIEALGAKDKQSS